MNNILGWIGAILFLSTGMQAQPMGQTIEILDRPSGLTQQGIQQPMLVGCALHNEGEDSLRTMLWYPGHVPTIATQAAIGTLSAAVLGGVGTFAAFAFAAPILGVSGIGGGSDGGLGFVLVVTSLAVSSGLTYGIVGVGNNYGGNGDAWLTFLGSMLGIAGGVTTAVLTENTGGYILGGTLALGTPILFYHLSADPVFAAPAASSIHYAPANVYAFHPTGMENHLSLQVLSLPLQF